MIKMNTTKTVSLSTIKELKKVLENVKDDMPIYNFVVKTTTENDKTVYKVSFDINK